MEQSEPAITTHIVVGHDFSVRASTVLESAISMVENRPDAMLHILAVLDEKIGLGLVHKKRKLTIEDVSDIQDTLTREIRSRLTDADPDGDVHFFVHVRLGKPVDEILRLAGEVGAYMILVGSHGHTGLERMLLGSVSESVVRSAKCPVLVVRERTYDDVVLDTIVDAPEGHAEERPYIKPHRYSYKNRMLHKRPDAWPLY